MLFLAVAEHAAGQGGSHRVTSVSVLKPNATTLHSHLVNGTLMQHSGNSSALTIEEEDERMNPFLAVLLLYGIMLMMVAAQGGLYHWRNKHKRSYELVTLLGLWLMPALFSFQLHFWRFVVIWAIWSAITARLIYMCMQKRMARTTPRAVYRWFLGVYKVSKILGVSGYVLLLLELFGVGMLLRPVLPPDLALDLVWYGLYFGVLGRDCAEVASDSIASALGAEGRKLAVRVHNCGICGQELKDELVPVTHGSAGHAGNASNDSERTVQLSCKHCFHEMCIRGWTLVGKKDTCPQCCEKVDLRSLYADKPWDTHNLSWIQMMDGLRYLVVWNPLILMVLSVLMHLFAPHHHHHGQHSHMLNGTLVNGTMLAGNATHPMLHVPSPLLHGGIGHAATAH